MTALRKALGARLAHAPATVEALLATSAAGLNRIARVGSLDAGVGGTSSVRTPCLSSDDFWARETEQIKAGALSAWAGGAATYSLGAGLALTTTDAQVCQSPACLARFRDTLKASYGGVDALNAAWGSDFRTWSDIAPLPLDQCQQTRQWAPWLDFRLEMNGVLADALRRARKTVLEIPGTGRTGFQTATGPVTPVMGYDWPQITTAVDYIAAPPDPYIVRRLQSYQPARPLTGVVLGYRDLRDRGEWARWMAWDATFRQTPAIWLEQPLSRGPQNLIGPDGTLMPELARLRDALDAIQDGPGDLLLRATPRWTGIALADSTASRYLDQADPEPGRTAEEAETWFEHALNQMGFAARIQPLEGTLENINTIILSRIRVLSDAEVEALKRFHDRGGLILSDGRAGRFDIHGTPRAANPLPFLHPLHPESPDDAFALWSNRPVWVSQAGEGAANREILAHLLARAGNEPSLPVQLPEKQDGAVSLFQFAYGAATIVACLPDRDAPTTVRRASLKLPDDTHAFSLLDAEASAVSRRIQWTIAPGVPNIYAILPYRVKKLAIETPALAPAGSRLHLSVALDTGDVRPGTHGLAIQLADPTGQELRHYRRFIETEDGRASAYIPLAHNELSGRYTLTVRDVLTRQTATAYIDVK
ncbi:MAG: beta-galactosidase [Candidatus Hydrogenedentes bacterium]|nr:beta-galactosidase [Candidatus Hydrogenedentota bacterium]